MYLKNVSVVCHYGTNKSTECRVAKGTIPLGILNIQFLKEIVDNTQPLSIQLQSTKTGYPELISSAKDVHIHQLTR